MQATLHISRVPAAASSCISRPAPADRAQPQGWTDGKNYIGPGEEPAGGARDREIVGFDGRVLITRFIDPEVSGRYGASIYVRCGAETVPSAKKGGAKKASGKG